MIVSHMEIVTVVTFLLFCLPILIVARMYQVIKAFNFNNLINTLNLSFPIQFVIAIVLNVASLIMDFLGSESNIYTDIIIETAYTLIVVSVFFYLPGLLLFNIVYSLIKLKARK